MNAQCSDLSIDDVMADPMIGTVMKADGVDPRAFRALLDRVADTRKRRGRCLDVTFQRVWPRAARPWAGLTPPSAKGTDCRAPLPW